MSDQSFQIRDREYLEALETRTLAPYAALSRGAHATRQHEEPEHAYRTAFQRDRDRIIHSRAFRRLKHKRQVFLTSASDHYRTRITHTLEVSQLSRTMARTLGLNEDLVEAIALGHDLGHTPFGHLGEMVLDEIMSGKKTLDVQPEARNFGGFKHNYQSLRVVDHLEKKYWFNGLNLTAPVREGILKHTRLKRGRYDFPDFYYEGLNFERDAASTVEGQVVAICDEIAQRTHDLEDGIRAGLVQLKQVQALEIVKHVEERFDLQSAREEDPGLYLGLMIRGLINELVDDVIRQTLRNLSDWRATGRPLHDFDRELVIFSAEMNPLQKHLNKFIYKEIIEYSRMHWADELAEKLLLRLFEAYLKEPGLLPGYVLERYAGTRDPGPGFSPDRVGALQRDGNFLRLICDHIAGMTDNYALQEAERLARLHKLDAYDLNLETALGRASDVAEPVDQVGERIG